MKLLIIFTCILLFVCSCHYGGQKGHAISTDTIFVYYYVIDVETSACITIEELSRRAEKLRAEEVITIDNSEYKLIKKMILECHNDSTNQENDARIYLKLDTFEMCLPYSENLISKKDHAYNNLRSVYLLKWRSGFYNSIRETDLKYFWLLKKYGIPQDYHFISYNSLAPPFKLTRKIALVKKESDRGTVP